MKPRLGTIATAHLLRCPGCRGELEGVGTGLVCRPCERRYRVQLVPWEVSAEVAGFAQHRAATRRLMTTSHGSTPGRG